MNIIELAKQAGLHIATDVNWMPIISLEYAEKFADLVAAQEREACAKVCDNQTKELYVSRDTVDCAEWLANEIRARGTT